MVDGDAVDVVLGVCVARTDVMLLMMKQMITLLMTITVIKSTKIMTMVLFTMFV